MRVAFYARSSNDAHDVSCESQIRAFEELAEKNGETVVIQKVDKAVSHFDATGFLELIELAKQHPRPFDKVYVYDTSRIARERVRQAVYMQEIERAGVLLHILKLPATEDKITDMMVKAIYGVFDEMHSMKSARDARRGMKENILQGYRAGGPAPYGYRLKHEQTGTNRRGEPIYKSTLEPDPEKAAVVLEIFQRAADGETRASIARDLARRGIPRARGKTNWTIGAVQAILRNWRTYRGDAVWNRSASRQRRRNPSEPHSRPEDDWVVLRAAHPQIVPTELTRAAGRRTRSRKQPSPRVGSVNTLAGLLYCGVCGARMQSWGEGRLVCPISIRGEDRCDSPSITHDLVVAGILDALEKQTRWEGRAEEIARMLVEEKGEGTAELGGLIVRLEGRISRWRAALEVATSDLEAVQVQQENLAPLYSELEAALAERDRIERENPPPLTYSEALAGVKVAFKNLGGITRDTSPEDLRALFRSCIQRVEFRPAKQFGVRRHSVVITWTPCISYRGSRCSGTGNRHQPRFQLTARLNRGRVH